MVYVIILFVIMSLIALINGDSSGVEAILKFIGYGAVIIGTLFIVAYVPWLIILIVVGIIIFAVCQSNSGSSANNSTSNTYSPTEYKPSDTIINNPNLTGFKAELQENTKTPAQVADESWKAESEEIINTAKRDYNYIKQDLLNKAKSGEYVLNNGKRHISITTDCSYLTNCISRKWSNNPTGRLGTSSYRANEKVEYHISKQRQYDLYLKTIQNLGKEDDILIYVSFYEKSGINEEHAISMPYTYRGMFTTTHKTRARLLASISY